MVAIKAQRINRLHLIGIVAIGLVLTVPAVSVGVFSADDLLVFHLKWSKHFSEQLWSGDLYPRWLLGMNAGLGSPTFFFYAPVPYYFTSFFHPLFASSDPQGWRQLSLSASFALIASGLTAYTWLKSIANRNAAFISALLYMALPYHLAIDLYRRFAFAEYWTFVWIPLILYFSKKIITGHKINIVGFAVSYALLIMSHLPTLLIVSIVPLSYVLLMADKRQRKKALIKIFLAMTLGVGLAAIYWLPAMTTQEYISMSRRIEEDSFYGNNFLFLGKDDYSNPTLWRYLEVSTMLTGGLACSAFTVARTNLMSAFRRESNYWIGTAIVALFMTLQLSKPLWDVLPLLQKVELPWRFDTVLTVATTALIALGLSALKKPVSILNKKQLVLALAILLATSLVLAVVELLPLMQKKLQFTGPLNNALTGVLAAAFIALVISCLKKPVNLSNTKSLVVGVLLVTSLLISSGIQALYENYIYSQSDVNTTLEISRDALEYRPIWVSPETFEVENISKLSKISAKVSVSGQGSFLVQRWQPRKIVLQVNAITDVWLTIKQFYYPGWTARLDGESYLLPVQPSKPEGLLRVGVPRGKHDIIIALSVGVKERLGQITSAVSVIIALFSTFWSLKVDQPHAS